MRIAEILFYDRKRVKLVVEMPDPAKYTTDAIPDLAERLFRLFPHLAEHRCHNDGGYTFRREARRTEIPHLLEHLIIELQTQARPHDILKGETQWNWRVDPRGTFHVHVEYENEMLVLACIRLAERLINAIDREEIHQIAIEEELARLRAIAQLGQGLAPPADARRSVPLAPIAVAAGAKGGRAVGRRTRGRLTGR